MHTKFWPGKLKEDLGVDRKMVL